MDFIKKEIIKELDLLVGCLTRLNPVSKLFPTDKNNDEVSTMEPSVEGNYIELNELEDKVQNLKNKILGEVIE